MSDVRSSDPPAPPRLAARLLDDQCRRWQQGDAVRVEAYLEQHPELREDGDALLDLVFNEVLLREERGEIPAIADYAERFPWLAGQLRVHFDVHEFAQAPSPDPSALTVNAAVVRDRRSEPTATRELPEVPGYEVVAEIGRGGMGVVYQAWQTSLHRLTALKMLLAGEYAGPQHLARFQTEAEAVARLQHPHIVQIYEVGRHGERPYIALEYVDGGNLAQKLTGTPWPARPAAELLETLSRAMHYAHQRGILHRDLTPGNVLLTADGVPKITDFGLAKIRVGGGVQTQSGAIVGTPSYMAPEQAAGKSKDIGPAADVYALGAILYELLTGRPPFRAETPLETLLQVRSLEPVPPSQLQPKLPRDLATICLKCLQKEPAKRYASAEALAEDVRRFLDGRPIQARPVRAPERLWRWCRRNPTLAALAASVILLLGTVAVSSSVLYADAALKKQRAEKAEAKARYEQLQAEESERKAQDRLWRSKLAQAHADRFSLEAGRRQKALEALKEAVRIVRSLDLDAEQRAEHLAELRNEAIASLAPFDADKKGEWAARFTLRAEVGFDSKREKYAQGDNEGNVLIRGVGDGKEIDRIPAAQLLPEPDLRPDFVGCHFSPDNSLLAIQYSLPPQGNYFVLWNLREHKKVIPGTPTRGQFATLAFSADSALLAAAQPDGTIGVYETLQGRLKHTLGVELRPDQLRFHPMRKHLAVSNYFLPLVQIWDVETKEAVATFPQPHGAVGLAWSPDGRLLAVGGQDGTITLWDVVERRWWAEFKGHFMTVNRLFFNGSSTLLFSVSFGEERTCVWDVKRQHQLVVLPGRGQSFRDDRQLVLLTGHDNFSIWELGNRGIMTKLPRAGLTVDFSPDGTLLATAGDGGVRLWDAGTADAVADLHLDHCETALFRPREPDGTPGQSLLTYGKTSGLRLWPCRPDPQGAPRARLVGVPQVLQRGFWGEWQQRAFQAPRHSWQRACWSSDGGFLAMLRTNKLLGKESDELVLIPDPKRPAEPRVLGRSSSMNTVALSPDGQWVATGERSRNLVRVWRVSDGEVVKDIPDCYHAAFSPDGRHLVTGGWTHYHFRHVDLWTKAHETVDRDTDPSGFAPLAFSADGKLLALATSPQYIQLVDPVTGQEIARLTTPEPGVSTWLCFSPDGARLAVAYANENIQLWDLRAVRWELKALDADWDQSPYPPPAKREPPVKVQVQRPPVDAPEEIWRRYWPEWRLPAESGKTFETFENTSEALRVLHPDAPPLERAKLYQQRAANYVRMKMPVAARDDLQEALKLAPDLMVACHDLARLYVLGPAHLRNPGAALPLARKAVAADPRNGAYRTTLGVAYYRLEEYRQAVEALERTPGDDAYDLYFLAMCHHRLGDAAKAKEYFDRARASHERNAKSLKAEYAAELKQFRAEAWALLGLPAPPEPPGKKAPSVKP
jgi:WD40 repeat protein/Tfp pilus assembly protein PilF